MKNILQLGVFLLLTNCTMKPQETKIKHSQFQELHKHKGSENYEIIEVANKEYETENIYVDSEINRLVVKSFNNPIRKSDYKSFALKLDIFGKQIDSSNTNRILKNGTDLYRETYSNWPISDDRNKYEYIDPLKEEEKLNPHKWLEKFKVFYEKASYVYIFMSRYYLNIDDKWYLMKANIEGLPDNLKQKYPPKEDQNARMLELENLAPIWYHKSSEKRDTSLIKMIDYESTFYTEENFGLVKRGYSAGWWYLEVYMPLGDTLRIKRYSDFEDPDLELYKIPAAYGGRNDVLFIVQKPNKIHIEQIGGMYVIRPKDPKQPERRYKSISHGDTSKGQSHILRAEVTEEYKNWKAKQKG